MKRNTHPWVFESTLLGYVAMWATRQSPYNAPDGLDSVLRDMKPLIAHQRSRGIFKFPHQDTVPADRDSLEMLLKSTLLQIPQVQQWNERKNGNKAPFAFVSRYDKPNPDDDFIDLGALIRNIAMSCAKEDHENWQEHLRCEKPSLLKAWTKIRYIFSKSRIPQQPSQPLSP